VPRASAAQRAQRLNQARAILQQRSSLSAAVQQLARTCSISPRQAYRYVKQARRLKHPVPVNPPKIAFTVKLPSVQVRRVRIYAARTRLTLSDIVNRALTVMLDRGRRRG
jgi:predicted DNA-binding transcriptional regulator YafY